MRLAWMPICIVVGVLALLASGGKSAPTSVPDPVFESGSVSYYVDSARGRDSNPGTLPSAAWRTLAPLQRTSLHGGDGILLRGGQRFAASIRLGTDNLAGTSPASKLRIGSYGGGRATIVAPGRQHAISAIDVAGVHISGVNLVGGDPRCRKDASNGYRYGSAGISVENRTPHEALDAGINIDHVDVSRFCNGIAVGSVPEGSRISHLRVSAVSAHDNASAGIWTYDLADGQHAIRDVRVSRTWAYRNGVRGGIVLFGVDGGNVERSVAFANGRAAGGGVGIWAFDSTRIAITHNESYRNGSSTIDDDGDGFDLDRGVSNSVMAHNYSHGNGGVGFLVCSCNGDYYPYYRMHNVTVRSNVSRNDGSSGQPSLQIEGGELMRGIEVAFNRVESARGDGPVVKVTGCVTCEAGWNDSYLSDVTGGGPYTEVWAHHNTFVSRGSKPLRLMYPGRAADLRFRDNRWRALRGRRAG
jgi:hypothetical protein